MEMSYSLVEISQVAKALLKEYGHKSIWAFRAPMGAGKTTLIAALCKQMGIDRKSTRLNSSHSQQSRMPSSA